MCHLARKLGWRTLVLAHRSELLEQTANMMRRICPAASVGILNSERREMDAQVRGRAVWSRRCWKASW